MLSAPSRSPARPRGRPPGSPPAPARSSKRLIPSPTPWSRRASRKLWQPGGSPRSGEGELPRGLAGCRAGRCARSVPISGTTTSSMPGARLRGTGTITSPRAAMDTAWIASGTGWSARSAIDVGGLGQLGDRSGVVVELLLGGGGDGIQHLAAGLRCCDHAWTAVARSAPPCGEPRVANIPTRSSQAAPWRRSSSISAKPRHDPALRVGDDVDPYARRRRGHLLEEVGQPLGRRPGGRPASRRRRSRTTGIVRRARRWGRAPARRRS